MKPAKRIRVRIGRARRAAAIALAGALVAQSALAQDAGPAPFSLFAGALLATDSNIFRLPGEAPEPVQPGGSRGRSDRITSSWVGLRVDTALGQQRFRGEAKRTLFRYDRFTDLDRDAVEHNAEWAWSLNPQLGGTLSSRRAESLLGFDLTQQRRPTEQVAETRAATLDLRPGGGWHMLAGVSRVEHTNTPGFLPQPDDREIAREAGLRYDSAAQGSLGAAWRRREGRYRDIAFDPGEIRNSRYAVHETELRASWSPTAGSTLFGRLARVDRRHEDLGFRDFSGAAHELAWRWVPTGRTEVTFASQRTLAPWFELLSASYRIDDTWTVAPAWEVTDRVKLRLFAYRTATDYRGEVDLPAEGRRHDVLRGTQLAAEWTPLRGVTLVATVHRDRRSSSDPLARFDVVAATLSLSVGLRDFRP